MGTIRKVSGEFFYRKDGVSYKFLNESDVKNSFPDYTDPIQIDDNRVKTFSENGIEFAFLEDVDRKIKINISPAQETLNQIMVSIGVDIDSEGYFDKLTPQEKKELKAIEASFFPDRVENEGAIVMPIEMYKENLRQAFYAGIMTITNRPITFDEWYENFIK